MRWVLVVTAVGLLVASATAQESLAGLPLRDVEGDADVLDVTSVSWRTGDGDLTIEARFVDGALPEGHGLRGVFVLGEPGSAEPLEGYQFTLANASHAFAMHGTPREVEVLEGSWNGSVALLRLERSAPATGSCAFAVVESGTFGPIGFTVNDVAPRGFASMESAWPVDACPKADAAVEEVAEAKDSPPLGAVALLGAVVALAWARRLR